MKPNPITVIVLTGGFLVTGIAWMLLPVLQSRPRKAAVTASEQVERARRMVDQYQAMLVRGNLVRQRLHAAGVDVARADLADIAERGGENLAKQFQNRWSAFSPMDWYDDPPVSVKPEGPLVGLMEEGLRETRHAGERNAQLLDEALSLLQGVVADSASANHPDAHRLIGTVLRCQGESRAWDARHRRARADAQRRELARLSGEMTGLAALRDVSAGSAADEHIRSTETAVARAREEVQNIRGQLTELDARIQRDEARLTEAETRAQNAMKTLDALRAAGINFNDPNSAADYEQRYLSADAAYRAAAREVQSLRFGRYVQAVLTPPAEFLTGRYLGPGGVVHPPVESGVAMLRVLRDGVSATQRTWETTLGHLQNTLFQLKGLKDALEERRRFAESQLAARSQQALAVFDDMARLDAEAETIEDEALDLFARSARAARTAVDAYRQALNEARTRAESLSPEAKEYSASQAVAQDAKHGGFLSAGIVDARLARARVLQSRYAALKQAGELLAANASILALREADAQRLLRRAGETREAGVSELRDAAAVLESTHRESGRHWTFVAQAGNLADLLAALDDSAARKDALEAYRSAIKGRENQPYVRQVASRITRLESAEK